MSQESIKEETQDLASLANPPIISSFQHRAKSFEELSKSPDTTDPKFVEKKKEKFKSRSYTLDHLWKRSHKKQIGKKVATTSETQEASGLEASSALAEKQETQSLHEQKIPAEETDENGPKDNKLDFKSRLQNLAFIFSLPHLVMLSNLQKLIGKKRFLV